MHSLLHFCQPKWLRYALPRMLSTDAVAERVPSASIQLLCEDQVRVLEAFLPALELLGGQGGRKYEEGPCPPCTSSLLVQRFAIAHSWRVIPCDPSERERDKGVLSCDGLCPVCPLAVLSPSSWPARPRPTTSRPCSPSFCLGWPLRCEWQQNPKMWDAGIASSGSVECAVLGFNALCSLVRSALPPTHRSQPGNPFGVPVRF